MKFGKPQVQLRRRKQTDGNYYYFLHVLTYFNRSGLIADGHYPLKQTLDEEGRFVVDLKFKRDPSIHVMPYLTPIVHTLNLGVLPFGSNEGTIRVRNIIAKMKRSGPNEPDCSDSSTSSSDEDGRPIDEEF